MEELKDERLESYRIAAYPVFLRHGKKGLTWRKFLGDLGLLEGGPSAAKKSKKLSRGELDALYEKAALIKALDQKGR